MHRLAFLALLLALTTGCAAPLGPRERKGAQDLRTPIAPSATDGYVVRGQFASAMNAVYKASPASRTDGDVDTVNMTQTGALHVSVQGTAATDTELPAAAALADATANPTTPIVAAALEGFNGTTWDRLRSDTTNGLDVDVTRMPADATELPAAAAAADAAANPTAPFTVSALSGYNGTTWDRLRSDTTNGLDVDVTRVSGTVTTGGVAADGAAVSGNPVLIAGQDGTLAQSIKTDSSGELQIDVLTMPADATELPAAASLADNTANPTVPAVGSFLHVWDGSTWDRLPGTSAAGATVSLGSALPAGTNNIGDVDVLSIAAGDNNIGNVDIVTMPADATELPAAAAAADGAANPTAPFTVAATSVFNGTTWDRLRGDTTTGAYAGGAIAHDAADTGNPLKIGGKAVSAAPSVVTANDRVNAYFDLQGRQYTTSDAASADVNANLTADADAAVAAATGLRLVGYSCKEDAGTPAVATFRIMHGATVGGGTELVTVELAANGSDTVWLWPGLACASGLSIDFIAGEVDVTLFYVQQQ